MNDLETITQAVAGDEGAQRALYETYHARAFRLAFLFLHDARDAEEVVQDAFVYVFRNIQRYDAQRGTFWAWLRVTVVSRCRNKRRRKRLPQISLEKMTSVGRPLPDDRAAHDPEWVAENRGARREVREALERVSPGAREALILRYYEELPYAEIADVLGCSAEAARARVAHGKVQLRHLLAGADRVPARRRLKPLSEVR
jgi:RNA polymerase sigma-70 factor (ECF subfamily)